MIQTRGVVLAWDRHGEAECLRVSGWQVPHQLEVMPAAALVSAAMSHGFQSMPGVCAPDGDDVCFVPRWPFVAGVEYVTIARDETGAVEVLGRLRRPPRVVKPSAEVVAIYPRAGEVPLNLLKIYVQFSKAMSEGQTARAVQVRRADTDEPLRDVFLPNTLELWDRERKRLTLLLDPGRIKRGLRPHEELGYPLAEGVSVVVRIDTEFRDSDGAPLRSAAEQRYQVTAALRSRVEPARWRVHAPESGTREALAAEFDRPLDRALLEDALTVVEASGAAIEGDRTIGNEERSWRFTPREAWRTGTHYLDVARHLEDVAGNSVARVFDRNLREPADDPLGQGVVRVPFQVR